MTTYTQARDTLATLVDTAWAAHYPAVPIFHENTKQIPLDKVGHSFVTVAVTFSDTLRTSVDTSPISESHGFLTLRLFAKEGSGVRATLGMIDFLTNTLKYQQVDGVTLDCPTPGRSLTRDGWTSTDIKVPFNFWQ